MLRAGFEPALLRCKSREGRVVNEVKKSTKHFSERMNGGGTADNPARVPKRLCFSGGSYYLCFLLQY